LLITTSFSPSNSGPLSPRSRWRDLLPDAARASFELRRLSKVREADISGFPWASSCLFDCPVLPLRLLGSPPSSAAAAVLRSGPTPSIGLVQARPHPSSVCLGAATIFHYTDCLSLLLSRPRTRGLSRLVRVGATSFLTPRALLLSTGASPRSARPTSAAFHGHHLLLLVLVYCSTATLRDRQQHCTESGRTPVYWKAGLVGIEV